MTYILFNKLNNKSTTMLQISISSSSSRSCFVVRYLLWCMVIVLIVLASPPLHHSIPTVTASSIESSHATTTTFTTTKTPSATTTYEDEKDNNNNVTNDGSNNNDCSSSGIVENSNNCELCDGDHDETIILNKDTSSILVNNDNNKIKIGDDDKSNRELLLWYEEMFSLPSDVPFPGTLWLSRLAKETKSISSSGIVVDNQRHKIVDRLSHKNNNNSHTIHHYHPNDKEETTTISLSSYRTIYEAIVLSGPTTKGTSTNAINHCRNLNTYFNSIIIPESIAFYIVQQFTFGNIEAGHYVLCYIRNLIAAILIYYGVALLFQYGIDNKGNNINSKNNDNTNNTSTTSTTTGSNETDIRYDQIQLAQSSLFIYVLLPVVDEYLLENQFTLGYYTIHEIGGYYWYAFYTIVYFILVEIGIYWMHRTLHTNKWLYTNIHMIHHKYNKHHLLTPYASIAFHPIDGILQASPYVLVMFVLPCHYLTHLCMLFFTAIWATYIHDSRIVSNLLPIMGSKYHTVHHTHYIYNYGQVFVFCDWFWNTLYLPPPPQPSSSTTLKSSSALQQQDSKKND